MKNVRSEIFIFLKKIYHGLKQKLFLARSRKIENRNDLNIPLLIQQRFFESNPHTTNSPIIALFFDASLMGVSSITDFSIRTFCPFKDKFHIFTAFQNALITDEILKKISIHLNIPKSNLAIFDERHYAEMDAQFHYTANVFILGNSLYNLQAFDASIRLYAHQKRNFLYLHDGFYDGLTHSWAVKHNASWMALMQAYYPIIQNRTALPDLQTFTKHKIFLIKPLIHLTRCTNLIVNSASCIPMIEHEYNEKPIQFIQAFLPIPDYRHIQAASRPIKKGILVAHFGIPHYLKQMDTLFNAIAHLNQTHEVKLLLAGYGVRRYVFPLPKSIRQLIIIEDAPSEDRLLSLMKCVDIAVQLRYPIQGQASGVVNEMLGLGLKCITTEAFLNKSLQNYTVEAPHNITPELLAALILEHQGNMKIPDDEHAKLLKEFSFEASANHIFHQVTASQKIESIHG